MCKAAVNIVTTYLNLECQTPHNGFKDTCDHLGGKYANQIFQTLIKINDLQINIKRTI